MISFTVLGTAIGQGSKRHVGNGVMIEQSKKLKPWRDSVAHAAMQAHRGGLIGGPIGLRIAVRVPRPVSHYGTKGLKPSAPTWPHRRQGGDADKIARAICDALSGVIYRDDKQVVKLEVVIDYGEPARCEVEVNDEVIR